LFVEIPSPSVFTTKPLHDQASIRVLGDQAERAVELAGLLHIVMLRRLGGAALERRRAPIDQPHRVGLMLAALMLSQAFCVRASIDEAVEVQRFWVFSPSVIVAIALSRSVAEALNGSVGDSKPPRHGRSGGLIEVLTRFRRGLLDRRAGH